MRVLDCGCELSPGGKLASLCALHAEHMQAVHEISKHPRAEGVDRILQRDLVVVIAPEVVRAAEARGQDLPHQSADRILEYTKQIMRRLD